MSLYIFDGDKLPYWLGMEDIEIRLPMSDHNIILPILGEPPFGDSYHKLIIDNTEIRGFAWAGNYLAPFNQEFLVCSWMPDLYARKTLLIRLSDLKCYIMKDYWYSYKIDEGRIVFGDSSFSNTYELSYKDFIELFESRSSVSVDDFI